ncbi:MAG: beta-ketoacyl-ACP synthase [Desulfobulbaceae bacterium]
MNRVVITGRGAVSPFGIGVAPLAEGCRAGKSAVRVMEQWRGIKGLGSFLAAPVPPVDAKKYLPRSVRRTMGDMALYATIAAQEAVREAGLGEEDLRSGDIGLAIGSTTGSPAEYASYYEEFLARNSIETLKSGMFFKIMGHTCSANVMYALGIRGEQWAPTSACSSSGQAIGLGYLLVKQGRQRAVLCGGADEVHHSVTMVFDILRAASQRNDEPQQTPRPFDTGRDGVVCGGGAGILVLESLESARSRGAAILAEITGFGHGSDPGHIANPDVEAMAGVMRAAIEEAGILPADIDHVNAHATGTEQGDRAEAEAIGATVGRDVPVSSMKGHIGHTLGASGALESILTIEMMRRGEIIPTLHLDKVDPGCGVIHLPQATLSRPVNTVIKNNFALGGVNVALVFRNWSGE